eukprot:13914586-Alexandrium_andersonii.AAC.1
MEVTTGRQAEIAATVLQRHKAAGQAHAGYLAELRDTVLPTPRWSSSLLLKLARGQAEKAQAKQAEL